MESGHYSPVNMDTFYGPLSVRVSMEFDFFYLVQLERNPGHPEEDLTRAYHLRKKAKTTSLREWIK